MNIGRSYEQAVQYFRAGRFAKATELGREILQASPGMLPASRLLARIAYIQDRYTDCIAYLEPVLESCSSDPELLLEYGAALRLANRSSDALEPLRKALEITRSHLSCLELGLALADSGAPEEARAMLLRALDHKADCRISIRRLGHLSTQSKRFEEAAEWYRRIVDLAPDTIHSYPDLIKTYLRSGNPRAALEECEKCLMIESACTGVFGLKYIALCELEDTNGTRYMLDFDRHIQRITATCPESFSDLNDFNGYFASYVLTQTEKSHVPDRYTTKHGWQTENGTLFRANKSFGLEVARMINGAVEQYLRDNLADPEHPVSKGRPSKTHLEQWCVVLYTGGHQAPHIHPKSWLSGAYYIQLPEDFERQSNPKSGSIVFGQGDYDLHPLHKPETRTFRPVEGDFVIFPSYAWHHTVPLQSTDTRICMAFDVVPTLGWGR